MADPTRQAQQGDPDILVVEAVQRKDYRRALHPALIATAAQDTAEALAASGQTA